ncbi:uncharacterized protein LOC105421439 [Amborella trichopoda]|uniref:uncharacterized protein LOC105421439 n=1 Tax=Amborella trichopoda TaxID=13333 RepID=UPI0005D38218|nr:uncharacterized protein LOC105421439 [Amborella trichopoda]|eukprot:XP_011627170.1 uncharacterized protein LOC105421439 [Amborella trichopoda]
MGFDQDDKAGRDHAIIDHLCSAFTSNVSFAPSMECIPFNILPIELADQLEVEVTMEELKSAVFSLEGDKAWGPDDLDNLAEKYSPSDHDHFRASICLYSEYVITDSVLVAQEYIHSRVVSEEPGVVIKLDIEKAYGRVEWSILLEIMKMMGFGSKWRNWIFGCVSSA